MVDDFEQLKANPEDFGGFQTRVLTIHEAAQRYCARRWCPQPGHIQLMIPGEGGRLFRVLCARHFVMLMVIQAAALGDPSPIGEGKRLAEKMGLELDRIPDIAAPEIANLDKAICERCGGGFIKETVGMYAGARWVHTCMTEEEKRAGE